MSKWKTQMLVQQKNLGSLPRFSATFRVFFRAPLFQIRMSFLSRLEPLSNSSVIFQCTACMKKAELELIRQCWRRLFNWFHTTNNCQQILTRPTFWVGSISHEENSPLEGGFTPNSSFQQDVFRSNTSAVVGVAMTKDVDYNNVSESFSIVYGQCINTYCKEVDPFKPVVHNMSDTLVQALAGQTVITATECAANREGLLCGQCKPGYALTMYHKVSNTCTHACALAKKKKTCTHAFVLVSTNTHAPPVSSLPWVA